jgi:hypothetical protein
MVAQLDNKCPAIYANYVHYPVHKKPKFWSSWIQSTSSHSSSRSNVGTILPSASRSAKWPLTSASRSCYCHYSTFRKESRGCRLRRKSRSVHVGLGVDKVALGQVSLRVLSFSAHNIIPLLLHAHSYIIWGMDKGSVRGLVAHRHSLSSIMTITLQEVLGRTNLPTFSMAVVAISDYGLDDRAIRIRSPARAKDFSSNLCVQTGSGGPPSLLYNGYRGSCPRGKARPGRDAEHSPPSSAEVKNE